MCNPDVVGVDGTRESERVVTHYHPPNTNHTHIDARAHTHRHTHTHTHTDTHTHTHPAQDLHFAEHILALKYLWAVFDTLRTENLTVCLC